VFESIKNRMWLLGVAKHELYSGLMKTDSATLNMVMRRFEQDMKGKGQWPFSAPELLSLSFSGWLGRNPALMKELQQFPK
jgi:hypothetical protein